MVPSGISWEEEVEEPELEVSCESTKDPMNME